MNDANASQNAHPAEKAALDQERDELLQHLDDLLEGPMVILAFIWLALLIGELVWGRNLVLEVAGTIIWILFIFHFIIEFILAPHKVAYLKKNWLIAISLLVPALRVFRIFRVFQLLRLAGVGRSASLFQVVSSLNRGMRALRAHLQRRGFGYASPIRKRSWDVCLRESSSRRTAYLWRCALVDSHDHDYYGIPILATDVRRTGVVPFSGNLCFYHLRLYNSNAGDLLHWS